VRRGAGWAAIAAAAFAMSHSSLLSCSPVVGRLVAANGGLCSGGESAECHESGGSGGSIQSGGGSAAAGRCDGTTSAKATLGYSAPSNSEQTAINCFKVTGTEVGVPIAGEPLERDELMPPKLNNLSWDLAVLNGGSDVLRLASEGRPIDTTNLTGLFPLDSLFRPGGLSEQSYFAEILRPRPCRTNDSILALPVGIHRANVLFANRKLVRQVVERALGSALSVEDCSTMRAVRAGFCLRDIESAGCESEPEPNCQEAGFGDVASFLRFLELSLTFSPNYTCDVPNPRYPFRVADKGPWLALLFYENLMVSHGTLYEDVWHARAAEQIRSAEEPSCPDVTGLLGDFERLMRLSDRSNDWEGAVNSVAKGCALATAMGDWGTVAWETEALRDPPGESCQYATKGKRIVDNTDVAVLPFPGTADAFVFASDVMVSRIRLDSDGAKACEAAAWFTDVASDPEVLGDYWRLKGSIPPMPQMPVTDFSGYQQATYERFQECSESPSKCRLLWAVSGVAHPSPPDEVSSGGAGGEGACHTQTLNDQDQKAEPIETYLESLWKEVKNCSLDTAIEDCEMVVARNDDKARIVRILNDTAARGPYCPDIP
jgi:hypothetical protein